jgi:hypothetical protein
MTCTMLRFQIAKSTVSGWLHWSQPHSCCKWREMAEQSLASTKRSRKSMETAQD